MAPRKNSGFTRTELFVALGVVVVLVVLLYPSFAEMRLKGQLVSTVSSCRHLHITTMCMAEDGADPERGWLGDLKERGLIRDTADFATLLMRKGYLQQPHDLTIFCVGSGGWCAPGFTPYQGEFKGGVLTPSFSEKNNQFKIFLVKAEDDGRTVFAETKNYTYNTALNQSCAKPLGDKGFIIGHKGGDIGAYRKAQAHDLKAIGPLPGGGTVENAENCLNPTP